MPDGGHSAQAGNRAAAPAGRRPLNASDKQDGALPFLVVAGLSLLLIGGIVLAPFLSALLGAASVALMLAPAYESLAARSPGRRTAVAAAVTGLVSLLVAVPFFLGGWAVLREAAQAYPAARDWINGAAGAGAAAWTPPESLAGIVDAARGYGAGLKLEPRAAVLDNLDQVSAWAGTMAKTVARNAVLVLLNLAVFIASLFLFVRDGRRMVERGTELIPLPAATKARLLARVRGVLLAVVNGLFLVALLQGTLAWAGLTLFRVPFAILLGAFCVLLSPIPFVGSALVWVPVVLYTVVAGEPAKAAGLALWFMIVVGLSDNLLRPIFLGTQMKLPIPLVFICVIGALKAFGFAGLFIGPLLIALVIGWFDIIRERNAA